MLPTFIVIDIAPWLRHLDHGRCSPLPVVVDVIDSKHVVASIVNAIAAASAVVRQTLSPPLTRPQCLNLPCRYGPCGPLPLLALT